MVDQKDLNEFFEAPPYCVQMFHIFPLLIGPLFQNLIAVFQAVCFERKVH